VAAIPRAAVRTTPVMRSMRSRRASRRFGPMEGLMRSPIQHSLVASVIRSLLAALVCVQGALGQSLEPFLHPYAGVVPVRGERPLLVILLDAAGEPSTRDAEAIRASIFGGGVDAGSGSRTALGANGLAAAVLPGGLLGRDVLDVGIAADDHVYAWYRDGTVSAGRSSDLTVYRPPLPFVAADGRDPTSIVGIAIAGDDHVYAWYGDGTVSAGTSRDLAAYRPAQPYALPAGKTPHDVLAIAISKRGDRVHAWYADGTASQGTSRDLAAHAAPVPFAVPAGRAFEDLLGVDFAASSDLAFAWFGDRGSVAAYFDEVSYGAFGFREAFVTPWLVARDDPATAVDESHRDWVHGGGIDVEYPKGAWVVRQVEAATAFRFRDYDVAPRDGRVTPEELAILWVYRGTSGRVRATVPATVPAEGLPGGVMIEHLARVGDAEPWPTIAHELAHRYLGLADLYVPRDLSHPGVGPYSLMCAGNRSVHLDPWSRMKLGWLTPTVVVADGWTTLGDTGRWPAGSALVLHDPSRSTNEYFIVENRWPGASLDRDATPAGLAVWHVWEGGDPGPQDDWGRRSLRLVWAAGPPVALVADDCPTAPTPLFDGAVPEVAYALTGWSTPAALTWRDGTPADFGLWFAGPSGPLVSVWVDVPPADAIATTLDAVAAGTTRDLDAYREPAGYTLPPGLWARDLIDAGIAADDRVYAWFRDGTVASGTSRDLAAHRTPEAFTVAAGRTVADLVAVAIASDDHVYAWYRDGTVSAGTSRDLGAYRAAQAFVLPDVRRPDAVLAIAIAKSNDHVYAWYRDGAVSSGTSRDLGVYRAAQRFEPPLGHAVDELLAVGIAGDDHVYAWFGATGHLAAGERRAIVGLRTAGVVAPGATTLLDVAVLGADGRPIAGATVVLRAEAGTFTASGTATVAVTTTTSGRAQIQWTAPASHTDAVVRFEAEASSAGVVPGRALGTVQVQADRVR
jgi:M6 family metalloprotease-like protein